MTIKDQREAARRIIARRPLLAGLVGLVGAGILGFGGYEALRMMSYARKHKTLYDDLLDLLADRGDATRVGRVVLQQAQFEPWTAAPVLRARLKEQGDLEEVLLNDAAEARLVDVEGWMLPESLGLLCALSAVMG